MCKKKKKITGKGKSNIMFFTSAKVINVLKFNLDIAQNACPRPSATKEKNNKSRGMM